VVADWDLRRGGHRLGSRSRSARRPTRSRVAHCRPHRCCPPANEAEVTARTCLGKGRASISTASRWSR